MYDIDEQHVEEGMNNENNHISSNEMNDINDSIFNYRIKDINLLNSPAPIKEEDIGNMNHDHRDLIEFAVEDDNKNVSDVSRGRLIENTKNKNEINKKVEKVEKVEKEEELSLFTHAMTWVSLTVTTIFYFIVLAYLYTKNMKWVYIIVSEVIIETFVRLIKITSMRYDYDFLMRPGKCIYNKYETKLTIYKNYLLKNFVKEEDSSTYSMRGFPSNHVTKCVSFLTLTYLFFPKYRKILRIVGPIYALLIIYSRMYLNCHTLLQSIGGVVVGFVGSNILYKIIHGLGLA